MARDKTIQGSLFEQDYLLRTLGSIGNSPDIALTELVANGWDAGASKVEIVIPSQKDQDIIISDNGCGLTAEQFRERWMTLGYDRVRHQGSRAEMPAKGEDRKRRAFGRNGVGRHGMLCFANRYEVHTSRDGYCSVFRVSTTAGTEPFTAQFVRTVETDSHGTKLIAKVDRNLPNPERIRRVLSARFMHDPEFSILVNGLSLSLTEHDGLVHQDVVRVGDVSLNVFIIDSERTARTTQQHGVAFWVGGRLVGEPSWNLGSQSLADGRTVLARRHTVVVQTEDLFEETLPDWTGFRQSEQMTEVYAALSSHISTVLRSLAGERQKETVSTALRDHREQLLELRPAAQMEVVEFVQEITTINPAVTGESLSAAVKAVISLEKSRNGQSLLQKLAILDEADIEGLNRLLETWTIRDALTVLDEIDRRLAVVEALQKFSVDKNVDELATLHPLVTQARWLFGAEFDSPLYSSNMTIRRAVQKVFGDDLPKNAFVNYRNRPDLMVLADGGTLCAVASEEISHTSSLSQLRRVLIIELKRGGFRITRKEINQASGYVEDLLHCGILDGDPFVSVFVVGDEIDDKVEIVRKIGSDPEKGRVEVATYGRLVRTANQRLFKLREELSARYEGLADSQLLARALGESEQLELESPYLDTRLVTSSGGGI